MKIAAPAHRLLHHRLFRAISGLALAATMAMPAHAQYAWVDEHGRRHYSDLPPPASVPEGRILRRPGMRSESAPHSSPAVPDSGKADTSSTAKTAEPTLADREAEFRKRRMEKAEKEKELAEERRAAEENRQRCERLREYQQALQAGERVARRTASGEREMLDDAARERELAETRRMMEGCR